VPTLISVFTWTRGYSEGNFCHTEFDKPVQNWGQVQSASVTWVKLYVLGKWTVAMILAMWSVHCSGCWYWNVCDHSQWKLSVLLPDSVACQLCSWQVREHFKSGSPLFCVPPNCWSQGIAKNNVAMKMLGEMEINPLTFWTLDGGMPLIVVIMEIISYFLVQSFLCGML
jgi:hypothetical protein